MSQCYSWVTSDHAGLWPLDDNANDAGPNALNGTTSSITYTIGKFGKAAVFNGSAQISIATGSIPAAMQLTEFTAMMWYKGTDSTSAAALLGAGGVYVGSNYQYAGYYMRTASGNLQLIIGYGGLSWEMLTGESIIDGVWHHIAATRDDSHARLYIDGFLNAEAADPGSPTFGGSSYYRFAGMGAAYVPGYTPLSLGYRPTCSMDDIQLLSRALTADEIYRLYSYWRGSM